MPSKTVDIKKDPINRANLYLLTQEYANGSVLRQHIMDWWRNTEPKLPKKKKTPAPVDTTPTTAESEGSGAETP